MGTSTKDEKVKESDELQSSKSKRRDRSKERDNRRRERSRSREHDRSKRRERSGSRDRDGRSRRRRRSDSRDKEDIKRRGRSRSPERSESSSKKEKDRDSHRHDFDTDRTSKSSKRSKDDAQLDKDTSSGNNQAGGAATQSLSIEDTNKLRAQLGLAPLQLDDDDNGTKEKEFVHVPAVNWGEMKETEKLKEKLATLREKRLIAEKLKNFKTLGEIDDSQSGDIRSWVEKSRKLEKEKEMAKKRATMLEEMDDEFGIGNLVEAEFGKKIAQSKNRYKSDALSGLKIEHAKTAFQEGQNVILTLQDKGILEDNNEDVLENVNIKDDEKASKNIELKKKKPDYQPYDDDEWDELGIPKAKQMLSKYDEVIDGEKKSSFRLGSSGMADMTIENELKQIKEEIKSQSVNLEYSKGTISSEFYTPEEMVQFKKPKKKRRKIRKSENLKADDLVPLESDERADHGSRNKSAVSNLVKSNDTSEPMDISSSNDISAVTQPTINDEVNPIVRNDDNVVIVDEAEIEMENILARNRRRKLQEQALTQEEKIRQISASVVDNTSEDIKATSGITFNTTTEFCRSLGETISRTSRRANQGRTTEVEADKDSDDMELDDEDDDVENSGWEPVNTEDEKPAKIEVDESEVGFMNDEPIVSKGTMAALLLASKKGYLDAPKKKSSHKPLNLPSTDYVVEDQNSYEIDDKFLKELGRSSSRYGHTSFKDKDDYKPGFKLEYFDDSGRRLNAKEAFRELSHRFHGKVSGKKKIEKRNKKLAEEEAFKKMSSTDTPLGTVSLMRDKMEQTQNAFLVLSGGGKGLINTIPITKDKK